MISSPISPFSFSFPLQALNPPPLPLSSPSPNPIAPSLFLSKLHRRCPRPPETGQEGETSSRSWVSAQYHLEALEKAKKESMIVFLVTGSGKTLIAVMLLHSYAFAIRKPLQHIVIFLIPIVILVTPTSSGSLVIKEGETLANVKINIQKKLQIPDDEFSKSSVFSFNHRSYQLEALEKAKKDNTIIFLETGSEKTLIVVMLLRSYAFTIRKPLQHIVVFLIPTVILVTQGLLDALPLVSNDSTTRSALWSILQRVFCLAEENDDGSLDLHRLTLLLLDKQFLIDAMIRENKDLPIQHLFISLSPWAIKATSNAESIESHLCGMSAIALEGDGTNAIDYICYNLEI
ncbi:hypothetical protein ZIOFF_073285 [Zingiber officinale]|uniref:Uncharacterized protein n=1 Tax=Zingiber officinale TaxID=94328 RepID=A0A8J5ETP5_ZINOF|nr:hypothetical protein ZIOFF_073285 [Zingiber officinale]